MNSMVHPTTILAAGLLLTAIAGAEDRYWTSGIGGGFGQPFNWDDGSLPAPGSGGSSL